MESSTARSDKDKAKEEERWSGINLTKTRRRIEDALRKRKSDPSTIIRIAEILGVEIAEELPEKIEIAMANIWEKLNKSSASEVQNEILRQLPARFDTFRILFEFCEGEWQQQGGRNFFTQEAAERHKQPHWRMETEFLNVIQMRSMIELVTRNIQEGKAPPLEPDEREEVKRIKSIIY
jgi:hypothetical protein